nr:hypothetical protein L204_03557 [Cryptococcus depauperatus CBS 7855]
MAPASDPTRKPRCDSHLVDCSLTIPTLNGTTQPTVMNCRVEHGNGRCGYSTGSAMVYGDEMVQGQVWKDTKRFYAVSRCQTPSTLAALGQSRAQRQRCILSLCYLDCSERTIVSCQE